jgi:lantibiotic biosynthesis protein
MDRRTFVRTLPALGLALTGCRELVGPYDALVPGRPGVPRPPLPPGSYVTPLDRAFGVVAGLLDTAEPVANGVRWPVLGSGGNAYPTDLYAGSAGVIAFLAEAYRLRPNPVLRDVLERAGGALRAAPPASGRGLFDGAAGRAWAYLSLHEALGGAAASTWLESALALAPGIGAAPGGLIGDVINGTPGQGLFLLRLHAATANPRWLADARRLADLMLARAVPAEGGVKYPSFVLPDGRTVFYTGMAHGAAGAGYFLCRLAAALPPAERAAYREGARAVGRWLAATARPNAAGGVNWLRREPDQIDQEQVQWCHGAPGIGLFFAELRRATGDPADLAMAERCAVTVETYGGNHALTCLCHGVAGNAALFLELYRITGDGVWLARARAFETTVWARRMTELPYPAWRSGDGQSVNNPGLLTGTAGVGWFYLQLATYGAIGFPGSA